MNKESSTFSQLSNPSTHHSTLTIHQPVLNSTNSRNEFPTQKRSPPPLISTTTNPLWRKPIKLFPHSGQGAPASRKRRIRLFPFVPSASVFSNKSSSIKQRQVVPNVFALKNDTIYANNSSVNPFSKLVKLFKSSKHKINSDVLKTHKAKVSHLSKNVNKLEFISPQNSLFSNFNTNETVPHKSILMNQKTQAAARHSYASAKTPIPLSTFSPSAYFHDSSSLSSYPYPYPSSTSSPSPSPSAFPSPSPFPLSSSSNFTSSIISFSAYPFPINSSLSTPQISSSSSSSSSASEIVNSSSSSRSRRGAPLQQPPTPPSPQPPPSSPSSPLELLLPLDCDMLQSRFRCSICEDQRLKCKNTKIAENDSMFILKYLPGKKNIVKLTFTGTDWQ